MRSEFRGGKDDETKTGEAGGVALPPSGGGRRFCAVDRCAGDDGVHIFFSTLN